MRRRCRTGYRRKRRLGSWKVLADLKEARERLKANPQTSCRPPSRDQPWLSTEVKAEIRAQFGSFRATGLLLDDDRRAHPGLTQSFARGGLRGLLPSSDPPLVRPGARCRGL